MRSSKRSLLNTPTVKSATYGDRAFSSSAPKLWNNIPEDIKSAETVQVFKTKDFAFKEEFLLAYSHYSYLIFTTM